MKRLRTKVLILSLLLCCVFSGPDRTRSEIQVSESVLEIDEEYSQQYHYYTIDISKLSPDSKYLKMQIIPQSPYQSTRPRILVSRSIKEPNDEKADYASPEGSRPIYFPIYNDYEGIHYNSEIYVTVMDNIPLKYTFVLKPLTEIKNISIPEKFSYMADPGKVYHFSYNFKKESIKGGYLSFSATGTYFNSRYDLKGSFRVACAEETEEYEEIYKGMQNEYHNGVVGVISEDLLESFVVDCGELSVDFEVTNSERRDLIEIDFRNISLTQKTIIYENEVMNFYIDKSFSGKIQFSPYYAPFEEKDENVYLLNWHSVNDKIVPALYDKKYDIGKALPCDEICSQFVSLQNTLKGYNFGISLVNEDESSAAQFQLFMQSSSGKSTQWVTNVVKGIPIKGLLPNKKIMYYKVKYIQRNWSYEILMVAYQGNPTLYIAPDCYDEKLCNFNINELSQLKRDGIIKEIKADNNMAYGISESEYSKAISFVVCNNEKGVDCKYDFTLKMIGRPTYLLESRRYIKGIDAFKEDVFIFNIKNFDLEFYIVLESSFMSIDFDLFSDPNLTKPCGEKTNIENKKIITFNSYNILGYYYIKVKGNKEGGFYNIYYQMFGKNEKERTYKIESGIITTEAITEKEFAKHYLIYSTNSELHDSFIVTFTPLNCKISVNSDEITQTKNEQFIFTKKTKSFQSGKFYFVVRYLSTDSEKEDPDEKCIFYISSNNNDSPLQLNEGVLHSMTLTDDVKKMAYEYKFASEIYSNFIFSLTKYDQVPLSVVCEFGERNEKKEKIITASNIIAITKDEISKNCFLNSGICKISITISQSESSPGSEADFQIILTSGKNAIRYLKKGIVLLDGYINNQQEIYYNSEISPDSNRNEVVINFKREEALVYGKLFPRDIGKQIPIDRAGNLIEFDKYNHKFIITESDKQRAGCGLGCEFLIEIVSKGGIYLNKLLQYSIYSKSDKTVIEVPIGEYIQGSLTEGNDYYVFYLSESKNLFSIEFNSLYLSGYGTFRNDLPTETNYDFKLENGMNYGSQLSSNSDKVTLLITSKGKKNYDFNPIYSFRILNLKSKGINVIDVTSSDKITCVPNEDLKCYFSLDVISHHSTRNLIIHAFTSGSDMTQRELVIKANVFSFEEYSKKDIKSLIPEENPKYTSQDTPNPSTLSFEIQENKDVKIYITVTSSTAEPFSLIYTFKVDTDKYNFVYLKERYQMYHLLPSTERNFEIPKYGDLTYDIEIMHVSGNGKVFMESASNQLKSEEVVSFVANSNTHESISIRAGGEFVFMTRLVSRPNSGFDLLRFNKPHTFNYINEKEEESFSLGFYLLIEQSTERKSPILDVEIQTKLNYQNEKNTQALNEVEIKGFIANQEDFINGEKINLDSKDQADSFYNKDINLGKVYFSGKKIASYLEKKNEDCYLLIQIKGKGNRKSLDKVYVDALATPAAEEVFAPEGEYLYYNNTNIKTIKLKKTEDSHKYIRLEFAIIGYSIVISDSANEKNKNITHTVKDVEHGKTTIDIEVTNSKVIFVHINKITENGKLMLRYKSLESSEEEEIIPSKEISIEKSKENTTITLHSLQRGGELCLFASYYVRLYEFDKYSLEEVRNLANIENSFKSYEISKQAAEIKFVIDDFPDGKYYLAISGVGDGEQVMYDVLTLKGGSVPSKNKGKRFNYLIIVYILLSVVIIFGLLLLYRKIKKDKLGNEIEYSYFKEVDNVVGRLEE